MQLGISTACFYPMLTENAVMEIGKYGVRSVEIFLNTFCELESAFVKEIKEIVDFYEMAVPAVHPFTCGFEPLMLFTEYDRRFNDGIALYRKYFEAMNILSSKIFVFHGDRIGSQMPQEKYFERFAALQKVADDYGITVAQENVERCKGRSMDFLCDMAKYLDGKLSVVFDNKQAVRSGIDYHEFIDKLGQYIVHVHMSDNGEKGDCLPFGEGSLDINEFIGALEKKGFSGCAMVELYHDLLKSDSQIFNSYEHLNAIID